MKIWPRQEFMQLINADMIWLQFATRMTNQSTINQMCSYISSNMGTFLSIPVSL